MPRKRQIDPGIWTSEQFTNLSVEARLLFIGLFSNADDEGRLKASPKYLKALIFPSDAYPPSQIQTWRDEVLAQGLIHVYSVNGSEYLHLPTYSKHQFISKRQPSRLPEPPKLASFPNPSRTIPEPLQEPSATTPELLPNRSALIGTEYEVGTENGNEVEVGTGSGISPPATNNNDIVSDEEVLQALMQGCDNLKLPISSLLADDLRLFASEFQGSLSWIPLAFKEAALQNVRKWPYVHRILQNCQAQGQPPGTKPSPHPQNSIGSKDPDKFTKGKYGAFFRKQ